MSQREKTLLLVGLGLMICSLVISEWLEPTDPQPSNPPRHAGKSMNTPPFPPSGFALNLPQSKQTMTLKNPRNIFAPLKPPHVPKTVQAPPPPPTHPPLPPPQPYRPPPPPQPTGPSPAELAARQAQQEMQQYTFFGYLTKKGVQQGFLKKGDNIYIVKQGERVEDGLEIRSMGPTAVVLSKYIKQAGTTVEATLPLSTDSQGDF